MRKKKIKPHPTIDNWHVIVRLLFDIDKKVNSRKECIKIWLRNIVKCGKYSLAKFAYFVLSILRAEIVTIFEPEIHTKFANFARLYFPSFTTFRNQILQFYKFYYVLFNCDI
jgi:hypothetical protein